MAEPSSAAKCWSWARATAGSAGRRLLRDTRRIWFRYLYPNCFLMACLLRSGTVASAIYAVIALLLLGLPAAHPKWTEPGCWRRLHLVLFVVSGILFVATSVLYTLCKVGSLSPSARHVTEVLVLGSATSSDGAMGCGADPMFVFPEAIAAAAGLVGWLLGPTAASEPEGQTVADSQKPNPLAESGRLKLVGLLLPVCAALDYNAFAAIYQLLAAILAASWAWCSPRRLSRATTNEEQTSEVASELPGCTRILLALLRAVLLLVAVAQLLLFVVASFPAVAGQLPAYVLRLLGARLSFWTVAQLQVCFLLMELLLWPGRENNPDGPVGSPGQEQGVPHQTSEELLRMEQAPSPVLLRRSPHSQRSVDSKVPSEPVHSLPQLSSSSRNAPPAKSAFLNWLVSAVEMASGHAFVPFISLWVLACAWPSLATLPLLLGAIGLMHLPLSGVPSFFLHSGLLYELLFSLALYGYNVFCFVAGEQFSRVPLVFTWMEQLGLQCYLREGPGSPGFRRFIWSLGQIFAVLLMAAAARHRTITAPTATRARTATTTTRTTTRTTSTISTADTTHVPPVPAATEAAEHEQDGSRSHADNDDDDVDAGDVGSPTLDAPFIVVMLARKFVAFARPFTAAFVLLFPLSAEQPSILLLGYLLWLVLLAASGSLASYVHSGWDALCASSRVWRCLLLYSNGFVIALFCWQVLQPTNNDMLGLTRSKQSIAQELWPHLCIGVLAAIQAQALHAGILIPAAFVTSTSALAWFLWIGGIFIEMALMFLLVMIEPFTVGSFLVLLLFIGTVAVEQFQPTSRWRNWLLTATGLLSATLLPLGYASMMPAVQSWLEGPDSPMPQADYQIMWQAFRLQDGASFEVRMKLAYLGGLLLLSASLRRVFKFGAEASLIGARTQAHLREHLLMMRVFLEVSRWSTAVLMFVSYFLMQRLDAFSRIQLGALLALLVSGRYWEYAGALISITSSVLLLAQYAYTFKFAPLPEEQADYWGLNWGYPTEVCLLLLGIVQRTVKRAATHFTLNSEMAAGFDEAANVNRRRLRQETAAYGAQLGMVLLMLVALFRNNAWSVVQLALVLIFRFSRDSMRRLTPSCANAWLWAVMLVLLLPLIGHFATEVWLPPGSIVKPSADYVADSWICTAFNELPCTEDGFACAADDTSSSCVSQQVRCSRAWAMWVDWLPPSGGGGSTLIFLAFFVVCLLRHLCLSEMLAEKASLSTAPSTSESSSATDADVSTGIGQESQEVLPAIELEFASEAEGGPLQQTSARSLQHGLILQKLPFVIYHLGGVTLILSLVIAALMQPLTNVISLGHMLSALWYIFMAEKLQDAKSAFRSRLRVVSYIQTFNLSVCIFTAAMQCPSFPCAFELTLQSACDIDTLFAGGTCPATFFSSPSQCIALQTSALAEQRSNPLSILMQTLGVWKVPEGLTFTYASFWNLMIFMSSWLLATACDRWSEEFKADLEVLGERLELRERWYTEHLLQWRRVDLSGIDKKHEVLLFCLQRLCQYLQKLRDIWAGKRQALTDQEKRSRETEARLMELCLKVGFSPRALRPVLQDFEDAAEARTCRLSFRIPRGLSGSSGHPDELLLAPESEVVAGAAAALAVEAARQSATEVVDRCVLEHCQNLRLQQLRRITAQEVASSREELLQRCYDAREAIVAACAAAEAQEAQEEVQKAAAAEEALASVASESEALETCPATPHAASRNSLQRQRSSTFKEIQSTLAAHVPPKRRAEAFLRRMFGSLVDDFLFTYDADDTLQGHRRDDGLLLLLGKAVWSQTLPMLIVAAMVRFIVYMSVASAVTVIVVLLTLMVFPHANPRCWKYVNLFNIALVLAKMLYQLPFIPSPLSFFTSSTQESTGNGSAVPWEVVLGFVKVATPQDIAGYASGLVERGLVHGSLAAALWADLLVCALLACHWHTLRHSGRMGSPEQICKMLLEDDSRMALPASSTGAAGSSDPSAEQGQEHVSDASGQPLSWSDFLSQAFWAALKSSAGGSCIRKPAMDLFAPRFGLLMVCFCMIITLWNSLTNSSESFGNAITSSSFSGRQVLTVILFLALLVQSRAEYTWYTQYRFRVDEQQQQQQQRQQQQQQQPQQQQQQQQQPQQQQPQQQQPQQQQQQQQPQQQQQQQQQRRRQQQQPGESDSQTPGMSKESLVPSSDGENRRSGVGDSSDGNESSEVWADFGIHLVQRALLLTQLLVLHAFYIVQWSNDLFKPSRINNASQTVFYLCFMAYLALTSLQLRFDVHVTRGGLGLTHSTDLPTNLVFKVYTAIPFLEEIRVLTDWTVTRTSLDFFMWMKLEDAQQSLYRTKRDMETRRYVAPAAPRPAYEKVYQGGLLLLALFALIVAPIALFSTLNPTLQSNRVTSATLTGSLVVQAGEAGIRSMALYQSSQASVTNASDTEGAAVDLYHVTFPVLSEEFFDASQAVQDHMARTLQEPGVNAWFQLQYHFQLNGDFGIGQEAKGATRVLLDQNTTVDLGRRLNDTLVSNSPGGDLAVGVLVSVLVKKGLSSFIRVSSATSMQMMETCDLTLDLHSSRSSGSSSALNAWSMVRSPGQCGCPASSKASNASCAVMLRVASEKIAPGIGGVSGSSSWSVVGIYIGVVYTVGRFLRMIFQDASKRIIYEELPDTSLLLNLCDGIYIARIQRLLPTEYKLYYQMMHIFRSPELLLKVSEPKETTVASECHGPWTEDTAGHGQTLGGPFDSSSIPRGHDLASRSLPFSPPMRMMSPRGTDGEQQQQQQHPGELRQRASSLVVAARSSSRSQGSVSSDRVTF